MTHHMLLLSSTKYKDEPYLEFAKDDVKQILAGRSSVLFIPYANPSNMGYDAYEKLMQEPFSKLGYELWSIHHFTNPLSAVLDAEAIFIGGGNTYELLNELYKKFLVNVIRERVRSGVPYIGSSAGTNVACANIATTNDMQIVIDDVYFPQNLGALALVPFNINPHYFDASAYPGHNGETRDERLTEFVKRNPTAEVVGLEEGSLLHRYGDKLMVGGKTNAALFTKEGKRYPLASGTDLSYLL